MPPRISYRKYKPPFCRPRETPYPKAPHSLVVQVTVFAVGPTQIAPIRVGLAAKSLAGGALDVSCPTGRCETCRVGFEGVNQIVDSKMNRTDGEPLVVPALVVIDAVWWRQTGGFLLEVFKDQLKHLGVFDAGNDFDLQRSIHRPQYRC